MIKKAARIAANHIQIEVSTLEKWKNVKHICEMKFT